ncbi:MAG: glucosamine-6-phosphate deaminase [Chthoniobacteraceae bacterium]|nr:glucosamine-6-phosphate deaminase [Chthoniobacteraceae bacterium]
MEIIIKRDAEEASLEAAAIFRRQLREKPESVLGLATGSTPLRFYELLAAMGRAGELDASRAVTFNLDEYVGLSAAHPQSYAAYMRAHLLDHLPVARWHIPDGQTADIPRHCAEYEAAIRAAGGIDIQLLGLGSDGHIGFNEPGSSLGSRTRLKTLTARTVADNAPHFASPAEVPRHVITMGVGTILEARRCVVLAFGKQKAHAVAAMAEGPVTAMVPASALQMHPACALIVDEAAAGDLQRRDYYRWVYENKPAWQRP